MASLIERQANARRVKATRYIDFHKHAFLIVVSGNLMGHDVGVTYIRSGCVQNIDCCILNARQSCEHLACW
ncbi:MULTISPECIES: hypothetical protein [Xanthobacter]|uniref:hypothetical protein n=1 Tax=Xanthobacter TaxID=279 RepID=UPI001AE70B6E|nr:hypothetical protein [Xanthobacter flavus]MBP2149973.1 hypothetical protein [Xanthobacter flavus]